MGEAVRVGGTGGASLPMLLTIAQRDPSHKVRSCALSALCALLEAPGVRSWPVPLERGCEAEVPIRAKTSSSFTPLAGQMATTLRQSHALVFGLLQHGSADDVQSALWACKDLIGCTPYPKLQSGLLSETIARVAPFLRGLGRARCLDAVSQTTNAAILAIKAAIKREDCSSELSHCLYQSIIRIPGQTPQSRTTNQNERGS